MERFPAAVVFADISGFTPLAERLARRGPAGAEALSDLLNAYFAKLTALIAEHRGEVITFAGDGLLAVWPATAGNEGLASATCDAGRCGLAVQSALGGYRTLDGLRLLLRIGVGAGEVMALRVGGDGGRWQLLLAGAPVVQGGLAEQQAAQGEVVLSPEAWELAEVACTGERLPGGGVRLMTTTISMGTRAWSRAAPECRSARRPTASGSWTTTTQAAGPARIAASAGRSFAARASRSTASPRTAATPTT